MGIITIVLNLFILCIVTWIAVMMYNYIEDQKNIGILGRGVDEPKNEDDKGDSEKSSSDDVMKQYKSTDKMEEYPSPVFTPISPQPVVSKNVPVNPQELPQAVFPTSAIIKQGKKAFLENHESDTEETFTAPYSFVDGDV